MSSDLELCYLSADEALSHYRAGKVSPSEVLEAQIERFQEVAESINAVTYTHFDEARAAAQRSAERYRNGTSLPLDGITVGVKDEHGLSGWTITQGSRILADDTLAETDPIAERLVEAGAVLHLQTTVPEFYLAAVTWTELWDVTRNPWNLDYAVGGSSGGSGAALAAGMCTLATGSDMGGSIRIPCAFNGLFGFKAPYGRVPTSTEMLLHIASSGPMGRTMADIIHMQNAISGPHPYAPTAISPKLEIPYEFAGIDGMRIAYSPDQSWAVIDRETDANTKAAVQLLRDQGAIVDEVDLNLGIADTDISDAFTEAVLHGPTGDVLATMGDRDQMTTYARYFAEKAELGYGSAAARSFQANIVAAHKALQDTVFGQGYEALVMPTLATSHVPADYDYTSDSMVIEGQSVHPVAGWFLTVLFNLLYTYPVVSLPSGRTSQAMPTGLQVVAGPYDDLTAFRVANSLAGVAPRLFTGDEFPTFSHGS
jgi:amidase